VTDTLLDEGRRSSTSSVAISLWCLLSVHSALISLTKIEDQGRNLFLSILQ
jgi:hypothetical protein